MLDSECPFKEKYRGDLNRERMLIPFDELTGEMKEELQSKDKGR